MSEHIISVDAGNGGVNAVRKKGKSYERVYFPSVRAAATGDSLGLGSQFEMDIEYVDWGGHRYFVGDDVAASRSSVERHQGALRYGDEFWIFLVSIAIAKCGVENGSVDLTTFAPPGLYLEAKRDIEARIKKMSGKVALQFKNDKKPRTFEIANVTVWPEGLGAVACYIFDKSGKSIANDFLEGEIVVLDSGMYTLDALQVSNGQFNPESLSSATWEGAGIKTHMLDPMLRTIKKQGQDFQLLNSDDIDRVVRQGLTTGDYKLRVAGQEVDIKSLLDKYSERYGEWISNNIIDGVFNGLRGVKSLILVGGGAAFIRDQLPKWYPDKLAEPLKDIEPVDMNAVGGLRLALSRETT